MDTVNTVYVYIETRESYITIGETIYYSYSDTVKTFYVYVKTCERYITKGDTGTDSYGYIVKSDPDIVVNSDTVETTYLYTGENSRRPQRRRPYRRDSLQLPCLQRLQ